MQKRGQVTTKTLEPTMFSVENIRAYFDPFKTPPWEGVLKLTRQDVARALADNRMEPACWTYPEEEETLVSGESVLWTPERHAARIAYLVTHGWKDPIEVDAGSSYGEIRYKVKNPVKDGNHRFAAAVYRGDETIAGFWLGLDRPRGFLP